MSAEPEQGSPDSGAPRCAGWLRRSLATVTDMMCFGALSAPLLYPVLSAVPIPEDVDSLPALTGTITDPGWSGHASGILGLWVALWWAYFIFGWGLLSATPGKWVFRLRVVDHRGRRPIGAARATLRLLAYMVSSAILGGGHLLILLRRDRRALHDVLAGTRVVDVTLSGPRLPPKPPPE